MTNVKVYIAEDKRGIERQQGAVQRDRLRRADPDLYVDLELRGAFTADLVYELVESHRSSSTLWFRVESFNPVLADDVDRYNELPVPIRYLPMRTAEFHHVLNHKTIRQGLVSGLFVFNKRGNAVSLELIR